MAVPAVVALAAVVALVALVALVAVAALPVILIPQVPDALVPSVFGAPIVLYEIVLAAEPSNVVPEAAPDPPLLNVTALVTEPAVVALVADVAEVAEVAVDALPVNAPTNVVAVSALVDALYVSPASDLAP